MIKLSSIIFIFFVVMLPIDLNSQSTFNQKEFDQTLRSRGRALAADGNEFYGMGSAVDSFGTNLQGYFFSKYDPDGKLLFKRYHEQANVLYLPGLTPEIIIQNNEAIIGMSMDGLKNKGELIYLNKETGAVLDSLVIAPHLPSYNVGRIRTVDDSDSTIMVVIGYKGLAEPATGLFLVRNKEIIADYTNSIPQFGQVLRGCLPVDDGYIIYFYINEWPSDDRDPKAYFSNWILKLNKEGKEVWQYFTDQGPDTDQGIFWISDMVVDEDGSMTMCNLDYIRYIDTLPVTRLRYKSVFHPQITKLDKDRNILWQRKMGNGKYSDINRTRLHRIVKSHEGDGYVTAGHLNNFDFRFDSENEDSNFAVKGMLAKVSNDGDSLWMREYTIVDYAPVDHYINTMEKTEDGGYVMYGFTAFQSNLDVRAGDNAVEAWILKVDTHGCLIPGCHLETSTSEEDLNLDVKVYPNPAADQLYIWHSGGERQYKLVDNSGVCIQEFEKKGGEETIILNVHQLHTGIYYLHVQDFTGRRHVEKIIVE